MTTERPARRKTPQDRKPKALKPVPEPVPEQSTNDLSQDEVNVAAQQEDLDYQKGQVQYLLQRVTILRAHVNKQAARIAELEAAAADSE